jgi:hypothetical protein
MVYGLSLSPTSAADEQAHDVKVNQEYQAMKSEEYTLREFDANRGTQNDRRDFKKWSDDNLKSDGSFK